MSSRQTRESVTAGPGYSIRVVSRLSGIAADTLRMWERRYGFPKPSRNDKGNRLYTKDDVDRLALISRAVQAGYRPGEVVPRRRRELEKLLADSATVPALVAAESTDLQGVLQAVVDEDPASARRALQRLAVARGARGFVEEVAAPLVDQMGRAWAAGRIEVRHEHLLSELLSMQIRLLHAAYADQDGSPTVLAATLPQEHHRLGLDMAALYLAALGAEVRILGPDTPAEQIVRAAKAQKVDAVAVSISAYAEAPAVAGYLSWIAGELPSAMELWMGGAGALRTSIRRANVRIIDSWTSLAQHTARLRAARR